MQQLQMLNPGVSALSPMPGQPIRLKSMTWTELDWTTLDRLREGFLQAAASPAPYWKTAADLANYDFTYAERIGWKWDHVLRELRLRRWHPAAGTVVDWGCGSGIAGRRVVNFFGAENFEALIVWDHSPLATDYAADAAARAFPALTVSQATPGFLQSTEPIGLLLISHVLNELSKAALSDLRQLVERAEQVLWVEPGTSQVSRQLSALRDEFRSAFRLVAPCTHELLCPALAAGNERHWCHFFAPPPPAIFADANWVKFGQRAGIDLRSLPYCFMALDRAPSAEVLALVTPPARESLSERLSSTGDGAAEGIQETVSRIIGRPEHFKPYARWLNCDATGLTELELPKRSDPALYKQLERLKAPLVYRWRRQGGKVLGGEALETEA